MDTLQSDVQSYLESTGFNLLDIREGFVVADELRPGGYHDTRLVWVAPPPTVIRDFAQLEQRLLQEFEALIPQYPNARYFLVVYTREGFSRDFRSELTRLRVGWRVPIQFFDTPFKSEEAPHATKSAIDSLRDPAIHRQRVPQPYSLLVDGEPKETGEDLLPHLLDGLHRPQSPCLRIVVGPAGVGKSILFKALFSRLYAEFIDRKGRLQIFPRPIPLIPDYMLRRKATTLRTDELIDNFCGVEMAARIPRSTFEWMLVNGYAVWLFDGLDELYAGDKDFFDPYVLDLLTRKESKTQILICARDSLLTSCETLVEFLDQFRPATEDIIRLYRLDNWEYPSKRAFAWVRLEGRLPIKEQADPPQVLQFLTYLSRSESIKLLSGVPFYCGLLIDEFKQVKLTEFADDIALIEHAVSGMIKREEDKGLLSPEKFQPNGLNEWLETVAWEYYDTGFTGLRKADIEEYAELVLRPELSPKECSDAITSLVQFPLFAPGPKTGVLTFEHELIGEYLTGRLLLNRITARASWVARSLGAKIDFAHSLIARYMAKHLPGQQGGIQTLVNTLRDEALSERSFANFLQLLLLAKLERDAIKHYSVALEGRDLSHVEFIQRDLQDLSLRNCNLSNTIFRGCDLRNAKFEGAHLMGTRFEQLSEEALRGARFGNLEHFEFIYVGKQRIEYLKKMIEWVQRTSGLTEKIQEPCPAALQLRTLFLRFVYPDGRGRRDESSEDALIRIKRYPEAPGPKDCINACLRFGYLQGSDYIKRTRGDYYNHIVYFVRNWKLTTEMRQLLNSLCPTSGCEHVPGSR